MTLAKLPMENRTISESRIERCLQSLRSQDSSPRHQRYEWRKVIQREFLFLRQFFPDSHALSIDVTDVIPD